MNVSSREMMLGILTGSIVLFGATILIGRPRVAQLGEIRQRQEQVNLEIQTYRALNGQRGRWDREQDALKGLMARFPAEQNMDVHWLSVMDRIAAKNGLSIMRRRANPEELQGDVHRMVIECPEWEGTLDALVKFLFDLQSEGAMFDVRQLRIKTGKRDILQGGFTLSCTYVKDAPVIRKSGPGMAGKSDKRTPPLSAAGRREERK
jgi:hypothetical protein